MDTSTGTSLPIYPNKTYIFRNMCIPSEFTFAVTAKQSDGTVSTHTNGERTNVNCYRYLIRSLRYEFGNQLLPHKFKHLLIQIAIKNGDTHRETMDMADYWLEEKDLVHKLFKVLVPRYGPLYDKESFTAMWRLPNKLPGDGQGMSLLELKGNPWPPIQPKQRDTKFLLTNILLEEFKKDYNSQKKISQSTKEISEKTNISKQEVEEIDSNNNASDSVHNKDTDRST